MRIEVARLLLELLTGYEAAMTKTQDLREYHAYLYQLQSAAREIANGHRVTACCRVAVPGRQVEVWANAKIQRARYRNVIRCADVWVCPVCANHVTAERRDDLRRVVKTLRPKSIVMMVSFTVRHQRTSKLFDTLRTLLDAWRLMTTRRAWDRVRSECIGYVKALEVTWGDANGWHPHLHVLFAWKPTADPMMEYARIKGDWGSFVTDSGGDSDIAVATRMTLDYENIDLYLTKWGLPEEMTRGSLSKQQRDGGLTPFNILDEYITYCAADEYPPSRSPAFLALLYREYMDAMRGKRQLTWSRQPNIRKEAGIGEEKSEEKIVVGESAGYVLLARLTPCQWAAIIKNGMRGALLDLAAVGDVGAMDDMIASAELAEATKT
jgi:hypothetical protein